MKKNAITCPTCGQIIAFDAAYENGSVKWSGKCMNMDCPTQPYSAPQPSLGLAKRKWKGGGKLYPKKGIYHGLDSTV